MPARHVGQDPPKRVGTVPVEVELEPPHLHHVGLLAAPAPGTHRVHPDEDVVPMGVQMAQPALKPLRLHAGGGDDALMDAPIVVRLPHGQDRDIGRRRRTARG